MFADVKLTLATKKKEQEEVQQQLQTHQTEIEQITGKMERTHDKRNGLRVGRVLAGGGVVGIPSCGHSSGCKIRKKTRQLEQAKLSAELKCKQLKAEISAVTEKIEDTQAGINTTARLSKRCNKLSTDMKKHFQTVEKLMEGLIGLKAATDSFSLETQTWNMKIELIAKLDDEKGVEMLMKQLHGDVHSTQGAKEFRKLLGNRADGTEWHDFNLENILRPSLISGTEKATVRTKVLDLSELRISE